MLDQLVLLETFDELGGGLDFSCRDPYTKEKRFVRVDVECGERRELSGRLVEIKRAQGVSAVTFYSGRMASFAQLRRSRTSTGLTDGNIGGVD
jgi:hypothetical protein